MKTETYFYIGMIPTYFIVFLAIVLIIYTLIIDAMEGNYGMLIFILAVVLLITWSIIFTTIYDKKKKQEARK